MQKWNEKAEIRISIRIKALRSPRLGPSAQHSLYEVRKVGRGGYLLSKQPLNLPGGAGPGRWGYFLPLTLSSAQMKINNFLFLECYVINF